MQPCWLCGSDVKNEFAKKNDYSYHKCDKCGLIAINEIPDNLSDFYSSGYFTGDLRLDGYVDYENEKKMTAGTFKKYLEIIGKSIGGAGRLFGPF